MPDVTVKWLDDEQNEMDVLDFGTITVYPVTEDGGEAEREFFIKNAEDSTATMEEVVVKFTGDNEEAVGWKQVKKEGGDYSSELSISDIEAGETSDKMVARTQVPHDATTGDHTTQLTVDYIYS